MKLARIGCVSPVETLLHAPTVAPHEARNWVFRRPAWTIESTGVGRAVPPRLGRRAAATWSPSLDLDPSMRSDRVIATAWDATFTLFDGVPTEADLKTASGQRTQAGGGQDF